MSKRNPPLEQLAGRIARYVWRHGLIDRYRARAAMGATDDRNAKFRAAIELCEQEGWIERHPVLGGWVAGPVRPPEPTNGVRLDYHLPAVPQNVVTVPNA